MFVYIGKFRYPAFVLFLLLYTFIISANLVIIVVISREKTLHEPMYIFIMCLSINSLYGSGGFFFRFLRDLLSDSNLIAHSACYTQIYIIYTYASYELTILGIMAYDRFVAICQPLHYHSKLTSRVISKLLAFAWIYPAFSVAACVYLASRLPLCGNKIPKVFCANWPVVKLSCVPTVINNIIGMFVSVTSVSATCFCLVYIYANFPGL